MLNHFCVCFERSGGFDHGHHFTGGIDARLFEVALANVALLRRNGGDRAERAEGVVCRL